VALIIITAAAPVAWAQDPSSSTTTAPGASSTTTTTVPGASSTTTTTAKPGGSPPTTTTVPPVVLPPATIPPELADDPRAPVLLDPGGGDGGEVPFMQPIFDPGRNQILQAKVLEIQAEIQAKQLRLADIGARLLAQQDVVDALVTDLDDLGQRAKRNVDDAASAEEKLRDHTVEAFISGSTEDRMSLVRTGDPVELGVAREMLGSVVDSDGKVLDRHREAQAKLTDDQQLLAAELVAARESLTGLIDEFSTLLHETMEASDALRAYQNGSQVYVEGFVFPVQGPTEFIDSWGYPRMTGTSSAHWHQGADLFADRGTPLVAAESGVIQRLGQASLGGNKLWVKGDSGTEYYYAHLTAFAAGMADGVRVNGGDVVGYVGDTGNARGTPPHLHFEVHPNGGEAVNPYPLLKAAYGTQSMVKIVPNPPVTVPPPVAPAPVPAPVAPAAAPTTVPAPAG